MSTVSYEWLETRALAETVDCPRCDAPAGQHCVNAVTQQELRAPAHFQRIDLANQDHDTPQTMHT